MSGLVHSPAHASDLIDGLYGCTTGLRTTSIDLNQKYYQINDDVAFAGGSCIGAVVIPVGVTSISENAFAYSALSSITIPASVTSIGQSAFFSSALTSITIPASVTSIGESVFAKTSALQSIIIPASVISIGYQAFAQSALTSITIPASVTSIGDFAFDYAAALSTVTFALRDQDLSFGSNAFRQTAVTSITIPASVTSIGANAFYGAAALSTVTFAPRSQDLSFGAYAFAGSALTSITIPASVTSINANAFSGATALTSVTFAPVSQLNSIGDGAFEGTALTSITIPASVTSISSAAFFDALALSDITVDGANPNYSSADGVLFNKNSDTLILYLNGRSGTSYTVPSTVTNIGDAAFMVTALASITIPASVTSIGLYSFSFAAALSTVTFAPGSQLTSIGDGAFQLTALSSITIPASVTHIGNGAFAGSTQLSTVTFAPGSQLTSIKNGAFYGTALSSITIPASVMFMGDGAFADASSLTSVYFLGPAPFIGDEAFSGVANDAKAFVRSADNSGYELNPENEKWNNLIVVTGVYVVTYNTFGGSLVTAEGYGANIVTPISPTRNGYTFAGWSLTDGGSVITFPHTPASAGDITLYARWTANSNTVTFNSNYTGGASDTTQSITSDVATNLTLHSFSRTGYTFAGWTTNADSSGTSYTDTQSVTLTAGLTLYVRWTANSNTVTFKSNYTGGASDTTQSITTDVATNLTLPSFSRTGYTFAGWTTNADSSGTSYTDTQNVNLTAGLTLYAKWTVAPTTPTTPTTVAPLAAAVAPPAAAVVVASKNSYTAITLAKRVGVKVISPKAKVTMTVASSSKKNCAIVAAKLKTLKAGKCVVTFTVQEPKPAKGKQPKATKSVKTLDVK